MVKRPHFAVAAVACVLSLPSVAQDDDMPTDDFLEYLATLVEDNGEWIDPMELDELSSDELSEDEVDINKAEQQPEDTQSAEELP